MCYHTWLPCRRHRTWHPTPPQYTDTGHDIPPRHSIQTQDMTSHPATVYRHRVKPVIELSIAVEYHTGSHNYLFASDPTKKYIPELLPMKQTFYFNAIVVAFKEKLRRECTTPFESTKMVILNNSLTYVYNKLFTHSLNFRFFSIFPGLY